MQWLVLGLIVFLGAHSVRIVADDWRARVIDRVGLTVWKAAVSLASLVGLALLAWGYALARQEPVVLWTPPLAMRHVASLLTLLAFVLLVAAYVPGNWMKVQLRHPMVLGVKLWASAHLLANGNLADLLLFGSFLVWAVLDYRAARRRANVAALDADGDDEDDTPNTEPDPRHVVSPAATVATLVVGAVAWAAFAFWLHAALFGVAPFGR